MLVEDIDPKAVLAVLEELEADYPGFRQWFVHIVVPGLDNGTRRIVVDLIDGRIVGAGIFKRTAQERKICTLWAPQGGALHLCRKGMEWLGTGRPSFTLAEDKLPSFRRLLSEIDAGKYTKIIGAYRPEVSELAFDGTK